MAGVSKTHAARIYVTDTCAPVRVHCRAVRVDPDDEWEFICTRPVEICVHIVIAERLDIRTALCEEHATGVRHQPGMGSVTRMHSL